MLEMLLCKINEIKWDKYKKNRVFEKKEIILKL